MELNKQGCTISLKTHKSLSEQKILNLDSQGKKSEAYSAKKKNKTTKQKKIQKLDLLGFEEV